MPCTSTGTLNITPLDSLSTVTALDSSSPEGRVKGEGENRGYESSSEESVGEKNNRDKRDTDESIEEKEKGVEDNIGNTPHLRTRTPDSHLQILPVPPGRPPIPYLPLGAYPADSSPPSSQKGRKTIGE
jgi:hypothetical protein